LFKDPAVRRELTENAYRDLVLSGRYTYKTFVESRFDTVLIEAGVRPAIEEEESEKITNLLNVGISLRKVHALIKSARMYPFPGRSLLLPLVKPLLQKYDRWREQRA
jgi:hypothetical protein